MKRSLSGIKPTGIPHLGNYLGMIAPAIKLSHTHDSCYFVANYHALSTLPDTRELKDRTWDVAAHWLAFGLDPKRCILFRQSDVPEVTELTWILSCFVSMGDLSRAHAYKTAKDEGREGRLNLGVFSYPVLMAADILLYDADIVPVGQDQSQHLEMARAIAYRFNHQYGDTLKIPQEQITKQQAVVIGTDGRKMSKSYQNTIEPLSDPKTLKKQIMSIVSDSKGLDDPKDPEACPIVGLYTHLANEDEITDMQKKYRAGGYGYGHAKIALLEKIQSHFQNAREKYLLLKKSPQDVEDVLLDGAERARLLARPVLERCRKACGLSS